jgi:hypothetical protein
MTLLTWIALWIVVSLPLALVAGRRLAVRRMEMER